MSLLEEFIFALSKTERQKLRPLQFRGAKRRIFLKILSCRDRKGIDTDRVIRTNKLSRQRYNQMVSEMLAACYRDVAPKGGVDLLQYLGNKQLLRHLHHEMRRQEAALIGSHNSKALESYYANVIIAAEFFMIPPQLKKLIDELRDYGKRYIDRKVSADPNDKLLIEMMPLEAEVDDSVRKGFDMRVTQEIIGKMEGLFQRSTSSAPLVKFRILRTLITYYSRILANKEKAQQYVLICTAVIAENPHVLGHIAELFALDAELEISRLQKQELDAEVFRKYFENASLWQNGFSLTYMFKFFPLLLQAGEFSLAKSFIQKYFPHNLDLIRTDIAIYYWKLLMLYHVYTGNLVEAEQCLRKALEGNSGRTRNVRFEVYLRVFDTFFAVLEDPGTAEDRIGRHIRYAHKHGWQPAPFMKAALEITQCIGIDSGRAQRVREKFIAANERPAYTMPLFETIYKRYFSSRGSFVN